MCNIHFLHPVPNYCSRQFLCLFVVDYFLPYLIRLINIHFWLRVLAEMFMLSMMKAGKAENFEDKRNLEVKQKTKIKPTYQSKQGIGSKSSMKIDEWKEMKTHSNVKIIFLPQRKLACERSKHTTQFRPSRGKWHCLISNMADLWCWTKQVNMKFKTINCTSGTARVLTNHPNKRSFSPKLNWRRFLP